jgi:magnesium-transporting ATPase (P-type)
MNIINTNTSNQTLRLTLDEGRQYFSTAFTHYLLVLTHEENSTTGTDLAQVPQIVAENQRITTLNVTTVGLTLVGRYRYEAYGQNSPTNLNPSDDSVVGLVEIGWLDLVDTTEYYEIPNITIQDDVIYNG